MAAKRKLDRKFAYIVTAVVLGSGVLVGGGLLVLRPKDSPQKYLLMADKFREQHDAVNAFKAFQRAADLTKPASADMRVQLAALAREAMAVDPMFALSERRALEQALEIDPKYLPANRRLMELWWAVAHGRDVTPDMFKRVRDYADAVLNADSKDPNAAALQHASWVLGWTSKIETQPDTVERETGKLQEIVAKGPSAKDWPAQVFHADLTEILAKSHLTRAQAKLTSGDADGAKAEAALAGTAFEDAVKASPDDLPLAFRALDTLDRLRRNDPKNQERFAATLRHATDLATPETPLYAEVHLFAANDMATHGNREGADAEYKTVMQARPNSPLVKLQYAEFLAQEPARRAEAIDLLSKPIDAAAMADLGRSGKLPAAVDQLRKLKLLQYRLDAAAATTELQERQRLGRQLEQEATLLARDLDQSNPEPKVLLGRAQMLQNHVVEAVRTFTVARASYEKLITDKGLSAPPLEYLLLLQRLSEAYSQQNLTGPAKDVLRQMIRVAPTYMAARAQLVQVLLREHDEAGAQQEFEDGERAASALPKDSELLKPWALIRTPFKEKGKTSPTDQLAQLPEGTTAQKVNKGRVALLMRVYPEAERLLSDVFGSDPGNVEVGVMLVQALMSDGKNDAAKPVLAKAMEKNPNELRLVLQQVQLNGGTAEDKEKAYLKWVAQQPELDREIDLYEFNLTKGNREAAMPHLKRAAELKPDDPKVVGYRFENALAEKDLKAAEDLLPLATAGNVDQAKGQLFRFRLAEARGDGAEALRIATQLSTEIPDFPAAWTALAKASEMQGNFAGAYNAYLQAIQRQPDNALALRGAILMAIQLNRADDVDRLIAEASARLPNDPSFANIKKNRDLMMGDADPVIHEAEERLKGKEKEPAAQYELGHVYSLATNGRLRKGDLAGAQAYAAKAVQSFGRVQDNLPATATATELMRLMATIAELAPRSGEIPQIDERLKRFAASEALKGRWEPQMILAEYYRTTGRPDDSVRQAMETLKTVGTAAPPRQAGASLLASLGRTDEAIAALDGAAADPAIVNQKLQIAINGRKYDLAEKLLRDQLAKAPNDLNLQNLLTNIYINTGRFAEAEAQVKQTMVIDKNDVSALYYRGLLQMIKPNGDPNQALQDFQAMKDTGKPITTEMRLKLVEAMERADKHDGAKHELADMLKAEPSNKELRLQYFYMLFGDKAYGEALQVVDDGLATPGFNVDPDYLMAKAKLKGIQNDAPTAIALARQAVGSSGQAAPIVKAYLELLLAAGKPKDLLSETDAMAKPGANLPLWVMMLRATAKKQTGDEAGAAQDFNVALAAAASAKNEEASVNVARQMAAVLGPDTALKVSLQHTSESLGWRLLTAYLYQSQGKLDLALKALEQDLAALDKLNPLEQAQVLTPAGLFMVSPGPQNNYDRAAEVYKKILQLNPDDLAALNNMAFLLSEKVSKPDYKEAMKYSERAYKIVRQTGNVNPLIYDTHGWVLVLNGRANEGIEMLQQAADRKEFMEVRYHLGKAYAQAKFYDQARRELARAKELSDQAGADPSYKSKIDEAIAANEKAMSPQGQPK